MKIIAEQLDVRDRSSRNVGVGEVAWEEDEGHVANVIRVSEAVDVSDFERRVPVGEENLGRVLDLRQPTRIHEFLHDPIGTRTSYERCIRHTWRKTFPNMRSVSSRKTVENMTVTRSWAAWI